MVSECSPDKSSLGNMEHIEPIAQQPFKKRHCGNALSHTRNCPTGGVHACQHMQQKAGQRSEANPNATTISNTHPEQVCKGALSLALSLLSPLYLALFILSLSIFTSLSFSLYLSLSLYTSLSLFTSLSFSLYLSLSLFTSDLYTVLFQDSTHLTSINPYTLNTGTNQGTEHSRTLIITSGRKRKITYKVIYLLTNNAYFDD